MAALLPIDFGRSSMATSQGTHADSGSRLRFGIRSGGACNPAPQCVELLVEPRMTTPASTASPEVASPSDPNPTRVALVTGASLGIGAATALALAEGGAAVVVNYRTHAEDAEKVVQTIRSAGGQAIAAQGDVSDYAAVERLVQCAVAEFGRLDVAIANAAYSSRKLFWEQELSEIHRTVDVTLWGAFHVLRAATLQMLKQGSGGALLTVSSPHAVMPMPCSMGYNIAKAGMEHMVRTAAVELAAHGIRVNSVQPGWTDTPGERRYVSEEQLAKAAQQLPMKRLATTEEVARGIAFLCDAKNSYITGATLLIDGGISLPWWSLPSGSMIRQS